ncbi:MAG TPA: FHA domain-containing protein [Verrucomicrobiae bacterium]|nr:FHA domain-containing protein [Verrucomicrobiae bacterium]
MARLILQSHQGGIPVSKDLNWGTTRVGRADDNDFIIPHPSVSGHHCEIELGLDFVNVRDCQSTNGTYIDNQRIQSARLEPGQLLRIGDVSAILQRSLENVTVPKFEVKKPTQSMELEGGYWSCERHTNVRADWQCPKCKGKFCGPCIHHLRLVGKHDHQLCPICSAHLEPISHDDGKKKRSVWAYVKGLLGGDK